MSLFLSADFNRLVFIFFQGLFQFSGYFRDLFRGINHFRVFKGFQGLLATLFDVSSLRSLARDLASTTNNKKSSYLTDCCCCCVKGGRLVSVNLLLKRKICDKNLFYNNAERRSSKKLRKNISTDDVKTNTKQL